MKRRIAVGVDLGGTNARLALVGSDAKILDMIACASDRVRTPDIFIPWVALGVRRLMERNRLRSGAIEGVGIGAPGPVDPSKGFVYFLPNLPNWKNVQLGKRISRKLRRPVEVNNDGNAMAQGEFLYGAARRLKSAVFLTLGTGIGGGMLISGRLYSGTGFSACEIGHVRYRQEGARCVCGSRGCIETELGNGFLLRKLKRDLKAGVRTRIRELALRKGGGSPNLEDVTRAASAGDPYARRFWAEAGRHLGNFLGGICNLLSPEAVVIGGGVMGAGRFLLTPLKAAIRENSFPPASRSLRVLPAKFGAESGLVGAAGLVFAGGRG